MKVELLSTGVIVPNGMGGEKKIGYADFIQEVSKLVAGEAGSISRQLGLPEGCFVIGQSGSDATIGMYFPERRANIRYRDSVYENVLIPNLVIMVELTNFAVEGDSAILNGIHWFCTDIPQAMFPRKAFTNLENAPAEVRGHIWCLPFPNMYTGNACMMCTGSNGFLSRFQDSNYAGLTSYYYDLFLGSAFNDDLSSWMIPSRPSWNSWLNRLSTAETFPYDLLGESND